MITLTDIDSTYIKINTTSEEEWNKIYNYFSVPIPNIEHSQLFKAGLTDGKKHFINANGYILSGLKKKIKNFCDLEDIQYIDNTTPLIPDFDMNEFKEFLNKLDLPFPPYKHQIKGVLNSLLKVRGVMVACTGSGKSLIIYILCRYFLWKNKKIILLCPRIDLVNQMSDDFKDYFYSKEDRLIAENNIDELIKLRNNRKELNCEKIEDKVHLIFGGQEKYTNKGIIISTRDSLSIGQGRVNEDYFKNIDAVLVDEVHTCGAQTSSDIVKACNGNGNPNMYKLGFTGSLSDNIIDNLIIEGLIGETVEIIKMRQLMDLGLATNVLIQPLYLKYNNDYCKDIKKMNWAEENKFIRNLSERCEFIAKLANSFKDKNVMIIYQNKDSAEEILKNIIKLRNPNKEFKVKDYQQDNPEKVYLSWGETKASNRNDFRGLLEKSEGNILAGTTSIISTGINIKNLHVFIFANVGKKDTLVIQSVGRLVRLHKSKDNAIIYDIVDDARYYTKSMKEYPNYHFKHWVERLETYTNQEFDVLEPKAVSLNLKEKLKF